MTSIDMHCAIAERPGSPPPAKSAISIRERGAMARGSAGAHSARPGRQGGRADRDTPHRNLKKKKKGRRALPQLSAKDAGLPMPARGCASCSALLLAQVWGKQPSHSMLPSRRGNPSAWPPCPGQRDTAAYRARGALPAAQPRHQLGLQRLLVPSAAA